MTINQQVILLFCINSQIAKGKTIGQKIGASNNTNQESLSFLGVVESTKNKLDQQQKSIKAIML